MEGGSLETKGHVQKKSLGCGLQGSGFKGSGFGLCVVSDLGLGLYTHQ